MPSSRSLAATAALLVASFVAAAPVGDVEAPRLEGRSSFSVAQVPNPGFKGFIASGTAARVKAYAKYRAKMPEDLVTAVSKAAKQGELLQLH